MCYLSYTEKHGDYLVLFEYGLLASIMNRDINKLFCVIPQEESAAGAAGVVVTFAYGFAMPRAVVLGDTNGGATIIIIIIIIIILLIDLFPVSEPVLVRSHIKADQSGLE